MPAESTVNGSTPLSLRKALLFSTLLATVFAAVFLLLTAGVVGLLARHKYLEFAAAAGISSEELTQTVRAGWSLPVTQENGHKNLLLLGLDSLPNRGEIPPLTDTIMLISIDFETGKVTALSLPRDLWSEEYQTKINALYYYGVDRYPNSPEQFPAEVVSSLTGVPIHHTLTVSLHHVSTVIDLLGGIEVLVEQGFTDTQFPRSDVDIHVERDPAILYKTVSFSPGLQTMDGATALEYIRSRHSADDQGTDDARAARQQQVVQALLNKTLSPHLFTDTHTTGLLYRFYDTTFSKSFPLEEVVATGKALYPHRKQLQLVRASLPISSSEQEGVLYHPAVTQQSPQWVYKVSDADAFREHVQRELGMR